MITSGMRRTGALRSATVLSALALAWGLAGCGTTTAGTDGPGSAAGGSASDGRLTLYSGRSQVLLAPLLDTFTENTGIEVQVRYAPSSELADRLVSAGSGSPADAFLSENAASLAAVGNAKLLTVLPSADTSQVPAAYRAADGTWVGVSGRTEILMYNPAKVRADQLPASVFDLAGAQWRGRVGVAPDVESFRSFVGELRQRVGDAKVGRLLAAIKAGGWPERSDDLALARDVDSGALDAALVDQNTLGALATDRNLSPNQLKARVHFFRGADGGDLLTLAGVGVLKSSDDRAGAERLVRFLLSGDTQRHFSDEAKEYPTVPGYDSPPGLPPLASLTMPAPGSTTLAFLAATEAMITDAGLGDGP